jgi:SprT protein
MIEKPLPRASASHDRRPAESVASSTSWNDLLEEAEQTLRECWRRFPLKSPVRLEWRNYRVTAGMAHYRTNLITLSTAVLTTREAVRDTVIHEFAHLLAFARCGIPGKGHGQPWQIAMLDLGAKPQVRHNYEVQRNTRRQQVEYRCLRCGVSFLRARRLPARRKFVHANCGGDLRLIRVQRVIETENIT